MHLRLFSPIESITKIFPSTLGMLEKTFHHVRGKVSTFLTRKRREEKKHLERAEIESGSSTFTQSQFSCMDSNIVKNCKDYSDKEYYWQEIIKQQSIVESRQHGNLKCHQGKWRMNGLSQAELNLQLLECCQVIFIWKADYPQSCTESLWLETS